MLITTDKDRFSVDRLTSVTAVGYSTEMALQGVLTLLFCASLVAAQNLPPPPTPNPEQCASFRDPERFDCFGEPGATQELCLARGCCWDTFRYIPLPGVPLCYFPRNYGGYKYVNVTGTSGGVVAYLQRTFRSAYPRDVGILRLEVEEQTDNRLHIKITDSENSRFETPYPKISNTKTAALAPTYSYDIDQNKDGFVVSRAGNSSSVIFSSRDIGGFIYSDQFLQISSSFSGHIYGLGEHRTNLSLDKNWSRVTMFNRDLVPNENDDLYGSHPFYLVMTPGGGSYGVYLHNSNPMDVILQPLDAVTFRTIGGVLDFYFFTGPSPADVIRQYTELIGRPALPPYWGLGYHLCRFGYGTEEKTREVWQSNRALGIPFDVQWNDFDYMVNQNDFTIDTERFPNYTAFINDIHAAGMHFIPIIDPGVSAGEAPGTYPPYDDGVEMDIFVKDYKGDVFLGRVWNAVYTAWPDFTHPRAFEYWFKQISEFYKTVPLDGIWIDMNEPSNFMPDSTPGGCPDNELENPQYYTGNSGDRLSSGSICMSAQHSAGTHYNVHNLFGISEAEVTSLVLRELGKRPFVVSRSTFVGSGAYTGHWSGDDFSSWYDLWKSIQETLTFNLYGIPLIGADICGFRGDTTVELCSRWHQLGAFYPFSRNHNGGSLDQDPASLGDQVVTSMKKAFTVRYTLLPYLYTLFYQARALGDTVARPLFFEFPSDDKTYEVDRAFFWGSAIYIIPVLEEGKTEVTAYFPPGKWYYWYSGWVSELTTGADIILSAPLDTIPVFIRGGNVLPTQAPDVTTTASRKNNFTLIAAGDSQGAASGTLFWDDGESLDTIENGAFGLLEFNLSSKHFTSTVKQWKTGDIPVLESVKVLGVAGAVNNVTVNGRNATFTQDSNNALVVYGLNLKLNEPVDLIWS